MTYQFDKAREAAGLKPVELAKTLDVTRATVANWANGSRTPTVDKVIQMAELFGVTTDYLLDLSGKEQISHTKELDIESIKARHNTPVWLAGMGWGLVNIIKDVIVFSDMSTISITEIRQPVYTYPPVFAVGLRGSGRPLQLQELLKYKRVWVEPISTDTVLQDELRGWYQITNNHARNEVGQTFYFDFYGTKWLAFKSCFEDLDENK